MVDTKSSIHPLYTLATQVTRYFSLADLRQLCRMSGVEYQSLTHTRLDDFAYEFVYYFQQRSQLDELLELLETERPAISWEAWIEAVELESPPPPPTGTATIGRDNIDIDSLSNTTAAVGDGAQVNITYNQIYEEPPEPTEKPKGQKSPYMGLRRFDEKDSRRFFGRDKLVEELLNRLPDPDNHQSNVDQSNFLPIIGASGSGKSSLVRAGLIPKLRERGWLIHVIVPGNQPIEHLAASLTRDSESVTATTTLIDDLYRDPRSLLFAIKRLISDGNKFLLVVDQFEELFTTLPKLIDPKDPEEQKQRQKEKEKRHQFVKNLITAVQASTDNRIALILTMRADFLSSCAVYPKLWAALEQQPKLLPAMNREELASVIRDPALAYDYTMSDELVSTILRDCGVVNEDDRPEPGILPLLSHALDQMWLASSNREMSLSDYEAAGRVQGAIAKTAEAIYNNLSTQEQDEAQRIFLQLTELGEGTEDTRRRMPIAALIPDADDDQSFRLLLTRLADSRLVTTDDGHAEVTHEALIREWQRFRGWLDENREALRLQRQIALDAAEWKSHNRQTEFIYRGVLLDRALAWLKSNKQYATQLELAFIHRSAAERRREQLAKEIIRQRELNAAKQLAAANQNAADKAKQLALANQDAADKAESLAKAQQDIAHEAMKRAKQRSHWLFIAVILLAVAGGLGIFANSQRMDAKAQQMEAEKARREAEQAQQEAESSANFIQSQSLASAAASIGLENPAAALLLGIESAELVTTSVGLPAIHQTASRLDRPQQQFQHEGEILETRWNVDARWNKNQTQILTIRHQGTAVKVWDVASGSLRFEIPHDGPVERAGWNSAETHILTRMADGRVNIWDAQTGQLHLTLSPDRTDAVGWKEAESQLLVLNEDRSITVSDARSGRVQRTIPPYQVEELRYLGWNSAETHILTFNNDTAKIWNALTGELQLILPHGEQQLIQAQWNALGSQVLTISSDHHVNVWDVRSGNRIFSLPHQSTVKQAKWNRSESRILTTLTNMVQVWDVASQQVLITLPHEGDIKQAIWNETESQILTTSTDNTAKLWDAANGTLRLTLTHDKTVWRATWNADESQILTRSEDDQAKVWDAASGNLIHAFAHNEGLWQAKWNDDESHILTSSEDGTAKVWDAASGALLLTLAHDSRVEQANWNADESQILTSGKDGTIKLWDTNTGLLLPILALDQQVNQAQWNQTGSQILIMSDNTVEVWNANTSELAFTLTHDGEIKQAQWNQDESKILTHGVDGNAIIWNAISGEPQHVFSHNVELRLSQWNEDESQILTISDENKVIVWDVASGAIQFTLSHDDTIYGAQWDQDESHILTHSTDDTAKLWDAKSGEELRTFPHEGDIWEVKWNQDGTQILTRGADLDAMVWDIESGDTQLILSHEHNAGHIEWNHSETQILTRDYDTVTLRDAANGEEIHQFPHENVSIKEVRWNQAQSRILTRSEDGTAKIWDTESGNMLFELLHESKVEVQQAEWNADETQLLTRNAHSIKLWDGQDGRFLMEFVLEGVTIEQVDWNSAETQLLVTTSNGIYRFYTDRDSLIEAACARAPRNLTWDEWQRYFPLEEAYRQTCPDLPIHPSVPEE